MKFMKKAFGHTKQNFPVSLYLLENADGSCLEIMDYGCRIRRLCVPDRNGKLIDVCLGYEEFPEYEADTAYLGAAVGRCANLIRNAEFSLNGQTYLLDKNDRSHHLHGGQNGFSSCLWNGTYENEKLIFSRHIPHLSDGYPGNLDVRICYEWTVSNELHISYEAVSDRDTLFNVTNHTYFNLEGTESSSVLEHRLCIASSAITEIEPDLIPTGNFLPVAGSPFDFRTAKAIGKDINAENPQLAYGCGYDHTFVLDGQGFRKAAVLYSPSSGIRMTCYTDQPGIQIYTANDLNVCKGKYGKPLKPRSAVCLETQHLNDAVHIPQFPSIILKAGVPFHSLTSYLFDV